MLKLIGLRTNGHFKMSFFFIIKTKRDILLTHTLTLLFKILYSMTNISKKYV